jgi:hypothetical protein
MGNPRNKRKRHPKPHVIPSLQASGQFTPKFPDPSSPEIISLYQAMVNQAAQRGNEERKRDQDARDKIQKDQSEKLMYRSPDSESSSRQSSDWPDSGPRGKPITHA